MLYTDGGLHPIDAPLDLVLRWDGTPDDFIKGMHGPNGLLDACRHGLEPKEAYRLAEGVAFANKYCRGDIGSAALAAREERG